MDIKNKIYCGDSLELIKEVPDGCVDFFLTDPPYGTNDGKGKNINSNTIGDKDGHGSFDIEWDRFLPLSYIEELPRIMKDDTWGMIWTDKKEVTTIWNTVESVGLSPRNTFYWRKTNKSPTLRPNFKSVVETAVVFTKGSTSKKWRGGGNIANYFETTIKTSKENVGHPTQKPIILFEHLISLFTVEGDLVFDPFIGSGTTAFAARNLGRNYLGIELDQYWVDQIEDGMKEKVDISVLKKHENIEEQRLNKADTNKATREFHKQHTKDKPADYKNKDKFI